MSAPKNILIAGSSGMVGSHLLQICLDSNEVNKIILISRKPSLIKDSKIEEIIIEAYNERTTVLLKYGGSFYIMWVESIFAICRSNKRNGLRINRFCKFDKHILLQWW